MDLETLLKEAQEREASDLHITESAPPIFRINGKLLFTDYKNLSREDTKDMVYGILNDEQKKTFEKNL
ncbi:unnamed protein product, partial [marine sediment metagenome]